jgi:hypothetical protein
MRVEGIQEENAEFKVPDINVGFEVTVEVL